MKFVITKKTLRMQSFERLFYQKLLLPVAIVNSHRLIRFKFFIPLFSKIVIKVGKPVQPPQSSSRDDLNSVTMYLQDKINNLIG